MVRRPLERIDEVGIGKKLVQFLLRGKTEVPVPVKAAAWLYTERKDDWRLCIVTPLVDQKSNIFTNLVVFDAMMQDDDLQKLLRKIDLIGTKERYARWLANLAPVGKTTKLDDLEIHSFPADEGIEGAYIYLST